MILLWKICESVFSFVAVALNTNTKTCLLKNKHRHLRLTMAFAWANKQIDVYFYWIFKYLLTERRHSLVYFLARLLLMESGDDSSLSRIVLELDRAIVSKQMSQALSSLWWSWRFCFCQFLETASQFRRANFRNSKLILS